MLESIDIQQASKRDERALEKIFDTYFDVLYFYVEKRINSTEGAENIISLVWEKVYKSIHSLKYHTPEYFKNWIYLITKNTLRDALRKNNIVHEDSDDYANIIFFSEKSTPMSILLEFEQNKELEKLVSSLPKAQGQCISMRYFESMSNKEISHKLGIGQSSVASNIKRGLEKLRPMLEK